VCGGRPCLVLRGLLNPVDGQHISSGRRARSLSNRMQAASRSVTELVEQLRERDFHDEEIRRMFEAALLHQPETVRRR
jgi:HD-GYP domain-containing protein (c-di-GMP phosphodiesterase class II)